MRKIIVYSVLLVLGLILSQIVPAVLDGGMAPFAHVIKVLTMFALAFIMIHVGYEFDIDKRNIRQYGIDYLVAATAAAFPWIFCAVYFVFFLSAYTPGSWDAWKESLLTARFAAPTSAGILFSMLIAGGLAATWAFRKVRILAIFDDLDTVLLMIPLKIMIVGLKWQLILIIFIMIVQLWLAWKYLHKWNIPITWPWVMFYSALIAGASEAIYYLSKLMDEVVTIHIEVLLPAFVLGCMITKSHTHGHETAEESEHDDILEKPREKQVTTIISSVFMLLVGLSMPPILGVTGPDEIVSRADETKSIVIENQDDTPALAETASEPTEKNWGIIALHVLLITLLSNLGKMFPAFCYRKEAHWRERLATAVALFPRGEVGAGVLMISLSYGLSDAMITVAMLSLALNLLCTGIFIIIVKHLIATAPTLQTAKAPIGQT